MLNRIVGSLAYGFVLAMCGAYGSVAATMWWISVVVVAISWDQMGRDRSITGRFVSIRTIHRALGFDYIDAGHLIPYILGSLLYYGIALIAPAHLITAAHLELVTPFITVMIIYHLLVVLFLNVFYY